MFTVIAHKVILEVPRNVSLQMRISDPDEASELQCEDCATYPSRGLQCEHAFVLRDDAFHTWLLGHFESAACFPRSHIVYIYMPVFVGSKHKACGGAVGNAPMQQKNSSSNNNNNMRSQR